MSRRSEQIRAAREAARLKAEAEAQALTVTDETDETELSAEGPDFATVRQTKGRQLGARLKQDKALDLRARGWTYRQIADRVGYTSPATAYRAVQIALDRQPFERAAEVRVLENEKLDLLEQVAQRELIRDALMVSHGRVVTIEIEGEKVPLIDHGTKLTALASLLRIAERRAKLNGLDAPTRVSVLTEDAVDAAIRELEAEQAKRAQGIPVPAE